MIQACTHTHIHILVPTFTRSWCNLDEFINRGGRDDLDEEDDDFDEGDDDSNEDNDDSNGEDEDSSEGDDDSSEGRDDI